MKKWWNDLRRYLARLRQGPGGKTADAAPLSPVPAREQPKYEQAVYQAIRWYGRRKVRQEIRNVHRRLITDKPGGALSRQLRRLFPGRDLR